MDFSDYTATAEAVHAVNGASSSTSASSSLDHGWQKVTYAKRQRRPAAAKASDPSADLKSNGSHVFASVEQKAQERRRALESAAAAVAAAEAAANARSRVRSDDDDDEGSDEEGLGGGKENGTEEVKKVKLKKPKKPKITVAEAASKIDASDLAAFLIDVTNSYESQPDILLMRFADYFGRCFSAVSASQFPWSKIFKESPVSKIVDVPLCHISEPVYKTAVDWIAQRPIESLGTFVQWSLDSILDDLAHQQGGAVKGSKKPSQQPSAKAQVAIFVVLAMTLRRKPEVLINLLSALKDNQKYQGLDKLPVVIWMIAQASQGELAIGMYSWARILLPLISGKSGANPLCRDLVLQSVERILSGPKARTILLNGAVRKGERLVPPSAMELLWRATFPAPSARVKATERFEAVFPTLKEIALAGSPRSKAMKPVAQQLLSASFKAMKENNPELSKEATDIFIWCLTQNVDCFKQWEKIYLENVDASAVVLKKLSDEWKEYSAKFPPEVFRETVKNLRAQNEEVLSEGGDGADQISINNADKYCKVILGRLSSHSKCMKFSAFLLTVAVAAGAFVLYPTLENGDLNKLYAVFSST